ncbi:P-loop containing nucleoside triphosphate hydrolase protein [Auriscalpium vulgare]|uniref:P-loop containing nucleoside triphosphate hydrolase protein n=1 Tax=Auriscalpium vulgare TaxID=40419 RepID=A0ACB8R7P4_9AGAM|nr:P-loop containing nucleoside triphosphate hydrolase protein [Auriscalpium vulgare]
MGLKNFQREDYERIVQREQTPDDERYSTGFIVGSEMGTGKTAVALAVICKGLDPECPRPGQPRATLVLVPGPGVLSNWTREITKFAPGLRVVVYHGAKRGTDVDALKKQDIILATYAQVVGQYKKYLNDEDGVMLNHPFFDFKFHRVILDEAHEIRNPETQRAKACFALCKVHGLCLTGTPAQNSARDFGSYFCFLSVRDHDLGKIDAFNDVIAQPIDDGEHGEALRILTTALSRLMIYRKLRLVAKLEDRYETRIDIEMKPQERAVYNYVLTMPELLGKSSSEEDKCEENNEKEDLAALIPVENGQLSLPDALNDTREVFDMSYLSSKIEKTSEIIQKIRQRPGDQKTIVFAFFKLTLDILESALKKHGIHCVQYTGEMSTNQRDNALIQIRDNPKYTVILMSLLAGAVGINVTSCSNVIIMEPWWNPYVEEQAIARAHRMGQTRGVTVYRLVVLGTIEERIAELQEKKKNTIDRVLNNMPARLSVQELDTLQNGL